MAISMCPAANRPASAPPTRDIYAKAQADSLHEESPSQTGGSFGDGGHAEGGRAAADEVIEIAVEDAGAGLQQQVGAPRRPAHRLAFVEALFDDLVDRGLGVG